MANHSIVSRLIRILAGALAAVRLRGSLTSALLTRFEVNERLDYALEEVAQRLIPVAEGSLLQPEAMRSLLGHVLPAIMDPRAIAYQILGKAGTLVLRSPNAPDRPFAENPQPGFTD